MTGRKAWNALITAAAGGLAGLFALHIGSVPANLKTPLFFPPLWILPTGWTVCLVLLVSAAGGAEAKETRRAFYVSLALMICWPVLFFRAGSAGAAAVCGLLHTGVWLHLRKLLETPRAQRCLLVCCVWAGYTVYLNLGIWLIN